MVRQESSFLSLSPVSVSSHDALEYLRFQFSRIIALLSFAKTGGSDLVVQRAQMEGVDPGCGHGLVCRMISSLIGSSFSDGVEQEKIVQIDKQSTQPLNDQSSDRNINGKTEIANIVHAYGDNKCIEDPFGLRENRRASRICRSRDECLKPHKPSRESFPSQEVCFRPCSNSYAASPEFSSLTNVKKTDNATLKTTSAQLGFPLSLRSNEELANGIISATSSMPSLQTASSVSEGQEPFERGIVDGDNRFDFVHERTRRNDSAVGDAHYKGKSRWAGNSVHNSVESTAEMRSSPICTLRSVTRMDFASGSEIFPLKGKESMVETSLSSATRKMALKTQPWQLPLETPRAASSLRLCLDGDLDSARDYAAPLIDF